MNESKILLHNLPEFWPIIIACVVFIVWLIRLESKVLYLENDHKKEVEAKMLEQDKIWEKLNELQTTLTNILQSLARLEGKLEGREHDRL